MNETWHALARNIYVRELILDEFIPKWTSTFRTNRFRQFLSQLEFATFNILASDGVDGQTNSMDGYKDFPGDLDASFFHHMTRLKHLVIHASDPLSLVRECHIPLALKSEDLPLLQSLRLQNCFIGPELVSFIRSHAQVLKYLVIEECFSGQDRSMPAYVRYGAIYWAEFFNAVYEAKPALTELIAGRSGATIKCDEFDYDPQYGLESESDHEIHLKLRADPTLRLIEYGSLHDVDGFFISLKEEEVEQFNSGNDQRAYDRLMGLINENATKASNSHRYAV